jgi:hypothetical protein
MLPSSFEKLLTNILGKEIQGQGGMGLGLVNVWDWLCDMVSQGLSYVPSVNV